MKKLLTKLLRYFCLMALIFALFFFFSIKILSTRQQFYNDYTASIVEKTARLESITEPKLILVGNSNVAFGIDSSILEEALDMPVVNLGLHGALGNMFHYNMAKEHIGQGDIVVLLNTHFDNGLIYRAAETWTTIENGKDYWKFVPWQSWPAMLLAFPNYIENSITAFLEHRAQDLANGPYERSSINEYGDCAQLRVTTPNLFTKGMQAVPEVTKQGTSQINALSEFCQQRGAVCLVAGYPIGSGEFTPPAEGFIRMQQQLEESLTCDLISDYTDYFYDYQYFHETQYHLTTEGARMRTEQLADDLLRWKATQSPNHS